MATTTDYLNNLIAQRNALADNLASKGVNATHDELFDTLVPKVLDISSGGGSEKKYSSSGLVYCRDLHCFSPHELIQSTFNTDLSLSNTITYEICFQYNSFFDASGKGRIWEVCYNEGSTSSILFALSMNLENAEFFIYQYDTYSWSILDNNSNIQIPPNEIHTVSCVIGDNISLYRDGILMNTFDKLYDFSHKTDLWNMFYKTSAERTDRSSRGTIYSVRVYNKALTQSEILYNYNVDMQNTQIK